MRVEVPRDLFLESAPVYRLVVATVDSPLRECLVPVNHDCLCRDTVGTCNDKSDFELSFRMTIGTVALDSGAKPLSIS